MKMFTPLAAGLLAAASAAAQQPDPRIAALFDAWGPIEVVADGADLVVVLAERRITLEIHHAVVAFGLCFADPLGVDISGIGELAVVNRFGVQGFVYEGGAEGCARLQAAPADLAEIDVAGETRGY